MISTTNDIVSSPDYDSLISFEEIKISSRINLDNEENLIKSMIRAAIRQFERLAERPVLSTTFLQSMQCWECPLRLLNNKVTDIESVKYFDGNNDLQTISDYRSDLTGIPALIKLTSFPNLSSEIIRPIQITYTAGFEYVADVPDDILQAIRNLVGHWVEIREAYHTDDMKPVPMSFKAICSQYRTFLGVD